ncbi:MAG: hypothetical protein ABI361_11745 [Nitrososphaera sp.]
MRKYSLHPVIPLGYGAFCTIYAAFLFWAGGKIDGIFPTGSDALFQAGLLVSGLGLFIISQFAYYEHKALRKLQENTGFYD